MKVAKRRRRENKTDYQARMELLKSGIPRIVIRKTNKYLIIQYVKSEEAKDKVIYGVTSKELLNLGWSKELEGSLKSLPACYLIGYYFGKKIIETNKNTETIFDMGLARNIHGSRIYAALKGVVDSGVKLNCNEKIFPPKDRIEGKNLNKDVQKNFELVKGKLK